MKDGFINKAAIVSLGLTCVMTAQTPYAAFPSALGAEKRPAADHPNFIYINTDDLGYGDVGCYGSVLNKTPNIDKLADEGVRFTDFYACPLCTPSRMALMTGSYPLRAGLPSVIGPNASIGISDNEITVAENLKSEGYTTAIVGKWHLGHQEQFLPTRHGFDSYFGIPYSNDFFPNLPLMRDEDVLEWNPDQSTITERYTEECINFMKRNRNKPFFLYMAHTYVHKPLRVTEEALGKSQNESYGAEVETVDWSVGKIMEAVQALGLEENTVVIFTSDNGGYLALNPSEGDTGTVSNAPLSGGKGQAMEGGVRVPFIVRWKGQVPEGKVNSEIASVTDIFPTFSALAGAEVPTDRVIDGKDILPLIKCEEGAKTPHDRIYIYVDKDLRAVRSGKWKLNIYTKALYDLENDIGEKTNLYSQHPDIVSQLTAYINEGIEDIGNQNTVGKNARPVGDAGRTTSVYDNEQGKTVQDIQYSDIPVIDLIDALPPLEILDRNNPQHVAAVEEAREAFNHLYEDAQEMVMAANYEILLAAEEKLRTIPGDVNGDGETDASDAVKLRDLIKNGGATEEQIAAGDLNDDGTLTDEDVTLLLEQLGIRLGDVSADGKVNAVDIMSIRKILLGDTVTDEQLAAGDLDVNGKLDATDIMKLRKMLLEQA